MKTDKLREEFLGFFRSKKHKIFPSDSLVPLDATVLFTSAGMNQFKPFFLGERKDVKRAASCQKCLRTGDLDKVGKTPYHHTFFEMLGNFSFGDYFKKEAIEFAWEFLTSCLNIKENDLWVSVYDHDEEAYNIWNNHIGVYGNKIVKLGAEDNFWPSNAPKAGPNGPCGPCSEIFFDRGKDKGCGKKDCSPSCSCGRFVEIWNLVFTQFNRKGVNDLEALPQKNIDTGMGLERMAAVLQGKYSNFEIDIFQPLVSRISDVLEINDKNDNAESVIDAIADHSRAVIFAISDGVLPSNEERGYVVRKLIRKTLWGGYSLGYRDVFMHKLVDECAELMGNYYPQIKKDKSRIYEVIRIEEEKFLSTIESAKSQFYLVLKDLRKSKKLMIDGKSAFKLYDTYGFPLELTKSLASENNFNVDEEGFYEMLELQKESSRKKSMFADTIFSRDDYALDKKSKFSGYVNIIKETVISDILKDKKEVPSLETGEKGIVIIDNTPFYAESGGQLADRGIIKTKDGEFIVYGVQKSNDAILHIGKVLKGSIALTKCNAFVDNKRRRALMRSHTATHLLQAALRMILGKHVTQQGSLVDEDRLRFDFSHFKALDVQELKLIEEKVNYFILQSDDVVKKELSLEEAEREGALAFFKDKYKDRVRVVSISDYSKELCGGTHVNNTSEIGLFFITNEFSVSSGTRRIEAVVGNESFKKASFYKGKIKELSALLKKKEEGVIEAVKDLENTVKFYKNKVNKLKKDILSMRIGDVINNGVAVGKKRIFVYKFEDKDYHELSYVADAIRGRVDNAIVFVSSLKEKRYIFVLAISKMIGEEGFSMGDFIAGYRDALGLKGGGKGLLAQGVLSLKPDKNNIEKYLKEYLSGESK